MMKFKKILFINFAIFIFTFNTLFSQNNTSNEQNITDSTGNSFIDYIKGRSIFGINFGPTLYAGLFDMSVGFMEPALNNIIFQIVGDYNLIGEKIKHNAFGLGFSYDFAPLSFMTVGFDIGFAVGEMSMNQYSLNFTTVPWSINAKFFFNNKAHYGFFLSPRIGGTAISLTGNLLSEGGYDNINTHGGFYLSLEIGWRLQLFPKLTENWPVHIGLDISLFDVGYYIAPWTTEIFSIPQLANFKGYESIANIRALFLPRLSITLRF